MSTSEGKLRLPLEGVRILDLGMFWAGPFAGKLLADAGAEVIKVESCSHPDNLRILARGLYPNGEKGEHPWNRSGMINERNRNKLGVTLELGSEKGRDIFRRLVEISDVVIENFSTRVLARWELDYENLRVLNPRIILCSIYSQGAEGPESGFVSFGGTLEQLSGLAYITGYPDELPGLPNIQLPDPLGGTMAAGLVIAALRQRRLTGEGCHIDFSQRENAVSVIGDVLLDYPMNNRVPERNGNFDEAMAPHGCYRCIGEDDWITLGIRGDEEWVRLCLAIGQPDLAHDERFATITNRQSGKATLDSIISEWTATLSKHEAMARLQAANIAAGAVYTAKDLHEDPHLVAREFWEKVQDVEGGEHLYPSRPFRLSKTPLSTRTPAPTLGQHNRYVLQDLLHMTDNEIGGLIAQGVIGDEPTEDAQKGRL